KPCSTRSRPRSERTRRGGAVAPPRSIQARVSHATRAGSRQSPGHPGRRAGPPRVRLAGSAHRRGRDGRHHDARHADQHGSLANDRQQLLTPMSTISDAIVLTTVAAGTGTGALIDLSTRRVPNPLTVALAAIGVSL